jgi:hypothetical protein
MRVVVLIAAAIAGAASLLPVGDAPLVSGPPAPEMSKEGLELVLDYECGGRDQYNRWPRPEFIGDKFSGVTWGVGYDAHQNSRANIIKDWTRLGTTPANRLSETQPFYGPAAREPQQRVKDIVVPWDYAVKVFLEIDLARVDAQCRRAFPKFDEASLHARDAIRSLVFNRGASMSGPARVEMREIRDAIAKKDYAKCADAEKRMCRVWRGTAIEKGMTRRRYAEAVLFVTPD